MKKPMMKKKKPLILALSFAMSVMAANAQNAELSKSTITLANINDGKVVLSKAESTLKGNGTLNSNSDKGLVAMGFGGNERVQATPSLTIKLNGDGKESQRKQYHGLAAVNANGKTVNGSTTFTSDVSVTVNNGSSSFKGKNVLEDNIAASGVLVALDGKLNNNKPQKYTVIFEKTLGVTIETNPSGNNQKPVLAGGLILKGSSQANITTTVKDKLYSKVFNKDHSVDNLLQGVNVSGDLDSKVALYTKKNEHLY